MFERNGSDHHGNNIKPHDDEQASEYATDNLDWLIVEGFPYSESGGLEKED